MTYHSHDDEKIIDEYSHHKKIPVEYPPVDFYDSVYDIGEYYYDEQSGFWCDMHNYNNTDYQYWYYRHVANNYQLNTRVFILRDPEAISELEVIINSNEFFKHVILLLDEYKPLKELVKKQLRGFIFDNEISDPRLFMTKNIIIPDAYSINVDEIHDDVDVVNLRRNNPIKIFDVGYSISRFKDHLSFKFF